MKEKVFPLFGDWVLKVHAAFEKEAMVGVALSKYECIFSFVVFGFGFQVSNVA